MLTALTQSSNRLVIGPETEKDEGPFVCQECGNEVVLKKGQVRIHHFAHLVPGNCRFSENESQAHLFAKFEIYKGLKDNPKCQSVIPEHRVGRSRADVYAIINGTPVAVELQVTHSTIAEVAQRTDNYKQSGVYCLWVLPRNIPDAQYSLRAWIRLLHAMYLGRVYYWFDKSKLQPVHFGSYKYTPGQICNEQFYQQSRPVFRYNRLVDIADFAPFIRQKDDIITHLHIGMVDCMLWRDQLENWWEERFSTRHHIGNLEPFQYSNQYPNRKFSR